MGYKFNPFTGNFDTTDSPDGVFDSVQVNGDINLDDGGTYTTTLQLITPTANRTISLPDATGTVGLVAGSSGQLVYNNAGLYSGAPSTSVGATGDITLSLNGAADTPPLKLTGTWFSGGTGTSTKPQFLIEPTGTTSTAWSTSGTGLGVNAPSGFSGNLLDLQVDGTSHFKVTTGGIFTSHFVAASTQAGQAVVLSPNGGASYLARLSTSTFFTTVGLGISGNPFSTSPDVSLNRDAADILAQRRDTNAQTYRLYNTYTDASNYQRTSITDDSTGLVIDQQYAGTGAARTNLLDLKDNGTSKALVDKDGVIASTQIGGNGGALVVGGTSITACRSYFGQYGTRLYSNLQFAWGSAGNANLNNLDTGLKRDSAGVVAITDGSTGTGYLKQTPVAVSALPAAATVGAGTRGFVSDSTVAASGNFGATVTGGGSNNVPVFSDGTNWLIG